MNLQVHLFSRIAMTGLACLLVTASLLLWRSHHQAEVAAQQALRAVTAGLELQLLKWGATLRLDNPFPDLANWRPDVLGVGDCLVFKPEGRFESRQACNGIESPLAAAPEAFETLYRAVFIPGEPVAKPVVFHKRQYGLATVIPSARREIAEAWTETSSLMLLAGLMLASVCGLVYWSTSRALEPSRAIVAGLKELQRDNLAIRLPGFALNEWRYIGDAINQLAGSQRQLRAERRDLTARLMNLQEDERKALARELHDEFGQCLAGINALSLSIALDARRHCPALLGEIDQVREISQSMLNSMRGIVTRLRPAEWDEQGFEASLRGLVAGWNARSRGATDYALQLEGNAANLPEPIALALFRAAQECLTNVAKHAAATRVAIAVSVTADAARLTVSDDGGARCVPARFGVGLLGMRERVDSLHGRLDLSVAQPPGLRVSVWIPLQSASGAAA